MLILYILFTVLDSVIDFHRLPLPFPLPLLMFSIFIVIPFLLLLMGKKKMALGALIALFVLLITPLDAVVRSLLK